MKAPYEQEAEERTWAVVARAFEAREPVRRRRARWPAAVAVAAAAFAAAALTPPGLALLDDLREAVAVDETNEALFELPAPGRLLVSSPEGLWVVAQDGSRRLVGDYVDGAWSPFGRFIVATRPNELVALEPDGDVRWALARQAVRLPAWGGTRVDTRIAYLTGSRLHVVAGDGTGDVDAGGLPAATQVRPAWRPGVRHVLAYVDTRNRISAYDTVNGDLEWRSAPLPDARSVQWSHDGQLLVAASPREVRVYDARGKLQRRQRVLLDDAAFAPRSHELALLTRDGRIVIGARAVFVAGARLGALTWSPDSQWLLASRPEADQWLFVRVRGEWRIEAISRVGAQFRGSAHPRGWTGAVP